MIDFARAHELVPQIAVLRLGKIIGLPLVILAVQRLPRWQLREAMRTQPGRGMLFIGLLMILSVPLSIWPGNSVGYIKGLGLISYLMFITTASVLVDRRAVVTILSTEVLAVGADAGRMLLPGAPVIMEGDIPRIAFSQTYDPNDSAALFLVTIPIALYLGGRRAAGAWRWLWYALALLMVVAMVRTGSRGGLLGLGAVLLALVLLAPPRRRIRLLVAGTIAAAAFAVAVSANPILRARFATTFSASQNDYNYTETNGRIALWTRGIHYMVTHPVTGVGINNFMVAELQIGSALKLQQGIKDKHMLTAHNSLVQIGAELGIPGLLAYLFVVFASVGALWRVRRNAASAARAGWSGGDDESALAAAALTALAGLFVGGFFLSLAYSPMTLFTFALCSGIIAGARFALRDATRVSAGGIFAVARRPGRRGGLARPVVTTASTI